MAGMDLLQLRGAMKRDPKAYEDELSLQLRHFQVSSVVTTYHANQNITRFSDFWSSVSCH
jgi:hypothetical protein